MKSMLCNIFESFFLLNHAQIEYQVHDLYNIGEDDCFDVLTSVSPLCIKWHDLCLALRLPLSLLSTIKKEQSSDLSGCL